MARLRNPLTNVFTSDVDVELDTARNRLTEIDEQIAEHQRLIAEVALLAVKASGADADTQLDNYRTKSTKLTELHGLRDAAVRWINELEGQKRAKEAEARRRVAQTQHNSMRSKFNDAMKEVKLINTLCGELDDAWERLHAKNKSVELLVGPTKLYETAAYRIFQSPGMHQLFERIYTHRGLHGQNQTNYRGHPSLPGADSMVGHALGSYGHADLAVTLDPEKEARDAYDWALREYAKELGLDAPAMELPPVPIARPLSTPEAPPAIPMPRHEMPMPPPHYEASPPDPNDPNAGAYKPAEATQVDGRWIPIRPEQPKGLEPPPRSEGHVFADGQSQVKPDHVISQERMDAAADKTLASINRPTRRPVADAPPADHPLKLHNPYKKSEDLEAWESWERHVRPQLSNIAEAAERTAREAAKAPRNPHPVGSEAYEETERVLNRIGKKERLGDK